MSERKSSKVKQKEEDEATGGARGFKLSKAVASEVHHESAIYEIDINGSVNFSPGAREACPSVRVCIANVAPVALEKKSTLRNEVFRIVENPFIESHYPRFLETDSESEHNLPIAGKADLVTQTSLSSEIDGNVHATKKTVAGKDGEENRPPSSRSRLRNKIKTQNTKEQTGKTESTAVANPDKEMVHVHHHEHHHHYHFDKKIQRSEGDSMVTPSKTGSSDSFDTGLKEWKRSKKRKPADEDKHKHACYFSCDTKSNTTFTNVTLPEDDSQLTDRASKPFKPSKFAKFSRLRSTSSIDSLHNKAFFPPLHTYSDTELVKCDSDEVFRCDVIRKKDSRTSYSVLVNSLKSLHRCVPSPLGSLDQKLGPKGTYIKCVYPGLKLSSTKSYAFSNSEGENPALKDALNKKPEITPKKGSDPPPVLVKRNQHNRSDNVPLQTWAEKIKSELKEIKRELRMIEKEFLKKKSSLCLELNENKARSEEGSGHEISVFSSRTFILRAENFYIIEESDSGPFSEDLESFLENDEFCYAETEAGRFLVSPNGSWLHFRGDGPRRRTRSSRKMFRKGMLTNTRNETLKEEIC